MIRRNWRWIQRGWIAVTIVLILVVAAIYGLFAACWVIVVSNVGLWALAQFLNRGLQPPSPDS